MKFWKKIMGQLVLDDGTEQQKKYRNSPDVAHLGLALLQVRQPELFVS